MAHSHEFDCRICGAHLDSREDLDRHNAKEHGQKASSGSSSTVNTSRPNSSSTRNDNERL